MRFTINGAGAVGESIYINDATTQLKTLEGVSVISGSGSRSTLGNDNYQVLTSAGVKTLDAGTALKTNPGGNFVIEGTGNGHNVGMSQYGAKAMAELGYTYRDILEFYYTDITIE